MRFNRKSLLTIAIDTGIAVSSGLVVVGIAFRRLVFEPGLVIYRDLFPGQLYYPQLWHSNGSFLGIENYKFVTFSGLFLPLARLNQETYEKAVYLAAALAAYWSFYLAAYIILEHLQPGVHSRLTRHLVSALGALTYLLNPAAVNIYFDFSLFVGYAFVPVLLLLFGWTLNRKQNKAPGIISVAVLWWLSAVKAHFIIFNGLFLGILFLFWCGFSRDRKEIWKNTLAFGGVIGLYLLLSAYWLLPFLQASQERFVGSFAPITYEAVQFLSFTPLVDVLRLLGSFQAWPYVRFEAPVAWLSFPWFLASWSMPVLAAAGLYWQRRSWIGWTLAGFCLVGLFLAGGMALPFGGIFKWLVFGPATPDSFRWLFRVASKWNVFYSLGLCGLATLALGELAARVRLYRPFKSRQGNTALAVLVLFPAAFILFAWPSFSGDFHQALDPQPLPEGLIAANRWLAEQEGDFKVNWMPVTNGRELEWNRRPSGDLYTSISSQPSIATGWNRYPVLFYSFAYESVSADRNGRLGSLLSLLNTRYIAYHDDVITTHIHTGVEPVSVLIEGGEDDLMEKIDAQQDVRQVWAQDPVTIYQVEGENPPLMVSNQEYLALTDLSLLNSLPFISGYSPSADALFFDSSRDRALLETDWDGLIFARDGADHLLMSFVPIEQMISPAEYTRHSLVNQEWSRFDIYQFDWQSVLREYKIDLWGYDYNQSMAAHAAFDPQGATQKPLEIPVEVNQAGQYQLWVRYLQHPKAGQLTVRLDGSILETIDANAPLTGFEWTLAGTTWLEAGERQISLSNQDGFLAVNALALLSNDEMERMEQQMNELARVKPALYLLEAETDFQGDFQVFTEKAEALSGGRAADIDRQSVFRTTLEIASEGTYQLRLRASISQSSAPLTVTIGAQTIKLQPGDALETLDWLESESFYLPKGATPISITVHGEALVDALALVKGVNLLPPEPFFSVDSTPPATIAYEQVDSTRYRALVKAQRPVTLILAETYDPLWQASGADLAVQSVPAYGVVNGFFLPGPGSYEILVEYKAQQGARAGLLISSVIAAALLPWLVAIFWKDRRGRFALDDPSNY